MYLRITRQPSDYVEQMELYCIILHVEADKGCHGLSTEKSCVIRLTQSGSDCMSRYKRNNNGVSKEGLVRSHQSLGT